MPTFLHPASLFALAVIMAFSVFSSILLGLYLIAGIGIDLPAKALIAVIGAIILAWLLYRASSAVGAAVAKLDNTNRLWRYAVLAGLVTRLLTWLLSLPVVQVSDGLHYLELANRLYLHQSYELQGYAFWPPGTPFIYTAFMWTIGQPAWIAVLVNCLSFLLTAVSVRSICRSMALQPRDAGLAVTLLALWPGLFLTAAQVSKETLLVGMLPAVLALLLSQRRWAALGAGMVTGMAVLTQPSLMLLPLFLCLALVAARVPARILTVRMALLVAGTVLVIAPWTYRNYQVFDEFVPVSTNAGLVLHAGNQPAMVRPLGKVGGFLEPSVPSTPLKNDAELSRWHKAQALQFILANKRDFIQLAWNRLVITLGDDSDSAYRSLRLTDKVSATVYMLAKAASTTWWMLLCAALGVTCWTLRQTGAAPRLAPLTVLAAGVTLYLMAAHGMAEGSGRHHVAWSWLYALILAAGLARIPRDVTAAAQATGQTTAAH